MSQRTAFLSVSLDLHLICFWISKRRTMERSNKNARKAQQMQLEQFHQNVISPRNLTSSETICVLVIIGAVFGVQLIYWIRNASCLVVVAIPVILFFIFAKKQRSLASVYNSFNCNPDYFRKFTLISSCLIGFLVGVYFMTLFTSEWELFRYRNSLNRIYKELMNCTRDVKDCRNR